MQISFSIEAALAEKNRAANTAAANPNLPQANYDDSYAAAKHQWLIGVRNQYVLRKASQATADAALATDLAIAKRKLVESRLRSQMDFLDNQTIKAYQLNSDQIDATTERDAGMNQLALQRWIDKATYTKQNAMEVAMAEKELTKDRAIIEADFQKEILERLLLPPTLEETDGSFAESQFLLPIDELIEDGFAFEKTHRILRRESARLKYNDAKEEAEATWKKSDNEARLNYAIGIASQPGVDNPLRLGESGVDKQYLEATSNRKKLYDMDIAMLANVRDRALTTAQITVWNEETAAENQRRTAQATADLDFWSVQESQRLMAHTSIRTDLATPWSFYLVRAAQARIAAFQLARPDYLGMVVDRNQSENRHRAALSSAFRIREDAMADARLAYSITSAVSIELAAVATAAAQYDYLQLASVAAKAFADDQADDANASPDRYYAEEATAWVAREKAMAQVTFDSSEAKTSTDHDRELAKIRSQAEYRKAESKAYAESVGHAAKIDRVFAIQHAHALMTAAVQTAQTYPTPWSYHDASTFSGEYSRTRKVSLTSEKRSRSLADIQAKSERKLADTDLAKHTTTIAASQQQASEQARNQQQQAIQNADIVQELADLGSYKTKHPTVADAPDFGSTFAIDSVESFGFYIPIHLPRSQVEPNSGWDFRPKTWLNSNEDVWALKASSLDPRTGNYVDHLSDGLRSFTQNPLRSHQAYAWWHYSNTRHWLEFTPSPVGQLVQHASQFNLVVPSKTVDDDFWNLDDAYARIASPAHAIPMHTLSPMEAVVRPAEDSLIVQGQKPELPFSPAGLVEMIEGIAKRITIDEIVRQMQSLNEKFAEFLFKSGSIAESAAARRPANALGEQAIPVSSTGQPNLVAAPNRSANPLKHESQFTISFDANVHSPEYEALRLESELKQPESSQTQAIAKSFQHHIDERTPGFRERDRIPRKDFYYENAEAVFSHDYIDLKGTDVYWVTRRYERNLILRYLNDYILYETKIGVHGQGGWVTLASGERATLRAVKNMAHRYYSATNEQINQALDAAISPIAIVPQSPQYGIFIGGTGMHFYGIGNIERLYNLYQGSKLYYGGVGNAIDFLSINVFASGNGLGGSHIIDTILVDIKRYHQAGQKIHVFGWSRGAVQANALAARLQKFGMRVDFLGMYDPVDSSGLPGVDALESESTWDGYRGNYVTAAITGNVAVATTIYAINEDRSFFPATYFNTLGATEHITLKTPGAHGEIGGHFQSNMPMQQLSYAAMLEYASSPGGVQVKLVDNLDPNVERIIMSPVTRDIALGGFESTALEIADKQWREAMSFDQWSPFTLVEYVDALMNRTFAAWSPGPYGGTFGLQPGEREAFAAGMVGNSLKIVLFPVTIITAEPPTPFDGHYLRNLEWVYKEIWDLPLRNGDRQISLDQETKDFIRSLYRKQVNGSKGGWIGAFL